MKLRMSMKRLIIVDISNFIFRAFYAIRPLTSPEGVPVNAVYGVLSMLLKLINNHTPTHLFLARDTKEETFRKKLYQEYKANRPEPPEDLIPQFSLIEKLVDNLGLPSLAMPGYEADDIIGSVVVQWQNDFDEVLIATGDKDIMQFVGGNTKILDTMKDKLYGRDEVFEKMGVWPEQIVDYLSMLGDASDNIPGMRGIGAKGAAKLLAEHNTLEGCIEASDNFTNKRVKNAFENHVEDGVLSKKLIEIVTNLDLKTSPDKVTYSPTIDENLINFLQGLGFKNIINKVEALKKLSPGTSVTKVEQNLDWESVENEKSFKSLLKEIKKEKKIFCFSYFDKSDLVHIRSLNLVLKVGEKYFGTSGLDFKGMTKKQIAEIYTEIWSDPSKLVISDNIKAQMKLATLYEVEAKAQFFDLSQAFYVIDADNSNRLERIIELHTGQEFVAAGKKEMEETEGDVEKMKQYCLRRIQHFESMYEEFGQKIEEHELKKAFFEIDQPLFPVLAEMEVEGVRINTAYFKELEKTFKEELTLIQEKVEKIAGDTVNLNSPKQVGVLLFEKLGLPIIKRTKTGASTDAEVLEELAARDLSDVPALLMKYRELDKLNSTYVSSLPSMVAEQTGKIHTSFNLNVAATGRLSSDHPNLQNIPVRSENGKKVRKGFIAEPGNLLAAFDYSQVELRLLAHFSQDKTMVKAFQEDKDIHAQTASEVLGVELASVTSNQRSMAKAVNFGLMYGQSSFGLAKTLKISRKEAKDYITKYFERFHTVKSYLDSLKDLAEEKGYSETLYGRKRFLPNIRSSNRTIKAMAERVAVNSPIQGTAADIIKLSMLNISQQMKMHKMKSRMLLQVHDELIFDVPEEELDQLTDLVIWEMENVSELSVPLKVDFGVGVNWYDIK